MDAVASSALVDPSEVIRAAQNELEQSIQLGGLARDPMRHPLRALSATMGAIYELHQAGVNHHDAVRAALASETMTAVQRATAEMRAAEAITIERISQSIAASAGKALTRRGRVFDRNTALLAAAVLFTVTAATLGAGFAWGQHTTWAAYQQTEVGLSAAFREGPEAARAWLGLMEANDPRQVLGGCTGAEAWATSDGRRACRAAIWIDRPQSSPPPLPILR